MKAVGRRALLAAAAAGVVGLAGAGPAPAQKPASVGDGVKTGQLSVQLFNYGTYISNGGNTGPVNPVTGVSAACATATTIGVAGWSGSSASSRSWSPRA